MPFRYLMLALLLLPIKVSHWLLSFPSPAGIEHLPLGNIQELYIYKYVSVEPEVMRWDFPFGSCCIQ